MSEVAGYKVHPAADCFPMMAGQAFAGMVADIKKNGLLDPIVVISDVILDGRNRAKACVEAGVPVRFVQYEGDDPFGFVISHNLSRRHLSESERSMAAAKLATLKHGVRADRVELPTDNSTPPVTQAMAAELMNVGTVGVVRGRKVLTKGVPELVDAVEQGGVAVSAAADVSELPHERQREVLRRADGNPRAVRSSMEEVKREMDSEAAQESLTPRQQAARELDAKVRDLWEGGGASNAAIAERLGCSASTVGNSLARQGLVKRTHPIQAIERKAREAAEDLGSAMLSPMYREGADVEQRAECVNSLRALISASKKVINWLNNEAIGG